MDRYFAETIFFDENNKYEFCYCSEIDMLLIEKGYFGGSVKIRNFG